MILNADELQKIMPHRFPFLMVDAILELEPMKRIVGMKCVTINEAHFLGHFPGKAVMPGVLIIEAWCKPAACCCCWNSEDREKQLVYLHGDR